MKILFFNINQNISIFFLSIFANYTLCMHDWRLEANRRALNFYQRPIALIDFTQEIEEYNAQSKFITIKTENNSSNPIDTPQNNPDYIDNKPEIDSKYIAKNYPIQFQVLFNPIAESLLADPRLCLIFPETEDEDHFIPRAKYQWRCFCKKPFSGITKRGMENHISKNHKTEDFYTCPYLFDQEKPCSKKSISPTEIVRHLSHEHAAFEICCNEIFDKKRYKEHLLEETTHH